ncbi:conjugal transfer protein TraG [Campylobacter helveticus]|nr:conjugal transfer protein TraG [Campylobacter helveticus]TXK51616.1 conjugal transfer protein TraG [Campylobacter helveticus]SMC20181.1 conjugal transfer mating pair stabilization protein TraG [Campylobacter helveticus]SUW83401.1 TraG-like protein [Campylobacter helveticus]
MKKVFLLFLFIFPSIALSATNIPSSQLIYTWGYGDVINEILQAIKGIILETDYIFKAAMAIALLIFSIKKLGDDRVSSVLEIGKMFGLFAVVWYFFLTAPNDDKHRFMIHDEVTSKDYIVSQIPTGIGATFALMSNFEKIMLDGMEKYFSTPQSANFSSAGLGFSLEAMMSLPKIKLSNINPTAQKNLDLFFRNCVVHGIRLHQNGRELYGKSDNFIDDLFDSIGRGSQLTLYYKTDKATGAETSDMFPCTEAGAKIKQDIMNSMDMAQTLHTALLGFEKDKALYEQKFQGAVQIFNTQATSARAYLQQSMLLFASQDAIINTAKSVGLDPAAVAANTAIADQNFFASMQTQGRLAQTYLPLAKAYLTAIIIGISWLIAILSVIFASYSYIRMFFVLCLWMTLWTPILCIINYLNDLNLMKVASVITEGRVALSVSDNMLIFRKVAESSNFINYMVMMTPLLAFAIAKGSEMGFVNLATGIAGSLTKAAGSGGSFSNQQGQSTESKMSAPKGDEVWAKSAGIESLQGAKTVDDVLTTYNTKQDLNNGTYNSEISNANMKGTNIGGILSGSSLSSGSLSTLNSISESNSKTWSKQFSDLYSQMSQDGRSAALSEAKSFLEKADEATKKAYASNVLQEIAHNKEISGAVKAKLSAYAQAEAGFKIFGTEANAGVRAETSVEVSVGSKLSDTEKAAYQEATERASVKTLSESKGTSSTWTNTLSGADSNTFSKMQSHASAYAQSEQGVQAVNSNNVDNTLNAMARDFAAADGKDFSKLGVGGQNDYFTRAGNHATNLLKNDPAQLAQYNSQVGASISTSGESFGTRAMGRNFNENISGSSQAVLEQSNLNQDNVNERGRNATSSAFLPTKDDVKSEANKNTHGKMGGIK